MKDVGWHVGMAQRQNPYLQIPLHEKYHVGSCGIDSAMGVQTWEAAFGTQADHLDSTNELLGYSIDIWTLARTYENPGEEDYD